MKSTTTLFTNFLTNHGITYTILNEGYGENSSDVLRIISSTDNMRNATVIIVITDMDVSANIISIATVPNEKKWKVLQKINDLNDTYRWITLYIHDDMNIVARIDAPIIDSHNAEIICANIMLRLVNLVDEIYPDLMKTIW